MEDEPVKCAVVRVSTNIVENLIITTPNASAPDGCSLVEVLNGQQVDIGWTFDGIGFVEG